MNIPKRKIPETLRDFLSYLPVLCNNKYNEVTDYFIWKTLNICLTTDNDHLDWRLIVNDFDNVTSNIDAYSHFLNDDSWKNTFIDNESKTSTPSHENMMCRRQCFPIETVYYCFTCTTNPLYEICEYCFDKDKHKGHNFIAKIVTKDEGRVCHCGNESVFKNPQTAYSCKNNINNKPRNNIIWQYDENIQKTINSVLDYIIGVLVKPKTYEDAFTSRQGSSLLLTDFIDERVTNDAAFQYHSTETMPDIQHADSVQEMIYAQYAMNKNLHEKWALLIEDENCSLNTKDLASNIVNILNKPAEFGISIVQALERDYSPVTILESDDFARLELVHKEFTKHNIKTVINRTHDVFKKHIVETLTDWLFIQSQNNDTLFKTLSSLRISMLDRWIPKDDIINMESHLATKEETQNYVINLFGNCSIILDSEGDLVNENDDSWVKKWSFSDLYDPKIANIMSNYDYGLVRMNSGTQEMCIYTIHGSRFQYILTECLQKLSKTSFSRMLNVICSIFCITDEFRKCLVAQYYDIYLNLLFSSVISESGRELSVISLLSQYTFQDPKFANLAIRNGLIERTLRFAFSLMNVPQKYLQSTNVVSLRCTLQLPIGTISNRRTIVCFKDLCLLLSTNSIPRELLDNQILLKCMIKAFSEFNNILPLKRETLEHVKFENFEFSSFYFFFSSMLILMDGYVRSITLLTDRDFKCNIIDRLLNIAIKGEFTSLKDSGHIHLMMPANDDDIDHLTLYGNITTVKEKICNYDSTIIKFQVGVDPQSFLNPMSYLFKFIIQWSQCGRYESLSPYLQDCLDMNEIFSEGSKALFMSESSLCTLVLLGQINIGFWVRNGIPISHQSKMYTRYSMREFTYVSDIFNVQFSLCMSDPNEFVATYFARWGLRNWSNGVPIGDYPDQETTVAIVNEALILLIQLLTETKCLVVTSSIDSFEKTIKTEIIHSIGYGSTTHSQLINSIPEHITRHAAFDSFLERYSNFIPATNPDDAGIFTLKEIYLSEIDPYYFGLSPNKRYELEKEIRLNMAEKENIELDDTYVPAKKVYEVLQNTPYSELYSVTSVDSFGTFLKNTLDYIIKFNCESLLPRIVHLIHICVVNNLHDFTRIFWREYEIVDTEFYHYHSVGSLLYSCLTSNGFLNVHGEIREIFNHLKRAAPHVDVDSYLVEQVASYNRDILWFSKKSKIIKDEEDLKKKERAKLRKDKILRKLLKQQKKFLENNSCCPSDDDVSMESSVHSNGQTPVATDYQGWPFPNDNCIFCKMYREDDPFVYFSYQELNACDHFIDFKNFTDIKAIFKVLYHEDGYLGYLDEKPLIRICGHGSHVSCLGEHMKSTRIVQSQTTKNIPTSFGYGLLYCPVCNSLSNSFIPRLRDHNSRNSEEFFNKEIEMQSILRDVTLSSSTLKQEAILIFKDLFPSNSEKKLDSFVVVNELLVNTVANLELRMRSKLEDFDQKIFKDMVPNQCLLTIRLLTELKSQLRNTENQKYLLLERAIFYDKSMFWYEAIVGRLDENLLIYVGILLEGTIHANFTGKASLLRIMMLRLLQDFFALCGNLIQFNFAKVMNDDNDLFEDCNSSEYSIKEQSCIVRIGRLLHIFIEHSYGGVTVPKDVIMKYATICYGLLLDSITTFMRRSYILYFGTYPDVLDGILKGDVVSVHHNNEFEFYLQEFRISEISSFADLINTFSDGSGEISISHLLRKFSNHNFKKEVSQLKFPTNSKIHLISLPFNFSDIYLRIKSDIIRRDCEREPAICLFCGKIVLPQRQVGLHKFEIGECTNHVRNGCPNMSTYGVFLMTKTNILYIAYGDRGTFFNTPYRNLFGETDVEFKLGTPVYLNERRYESFTNDVVLGNMIPHIVFRKTDGNLDLGGWETI